jgi:hypothetical protein
MGHNNHDGVAIVTFRTAKNRVVYDFEVYPNFLCVGIIQYDKGIKSMVEVSETNNQYLQLSYIIESLRGSSIMIGYNNVGFDWPIFEAIRVGIAKGIVDWKGLCSIAYSKCDEIISDGNKAQKHPDEFSHLKWKHQIYDPIVPQLDLFLLHHFDNKMVSLKTLEFNMGMEHVRSLPIKAGTITTRDEQLELMDYCLSYDCVATVEFLNRSLDKIDMREEYTKEYGYNFNSASDSKMGSVFMDRKLRDAEIDTKHKVGGKWVNKGTPRPLIKMTDVILDINEFRTPEFRAVKDFLLTMELTKTKEVFLDLPTSELGELRNYLDPAHVKRGMTRLGKVFPERLKDLHCTLNGFTFVFGTGGLHASVEKEWFDCKDDETIDDIDVASFYPSLAIVNGWFPEHLGAEFVRIYSAMLADRKRYPKSTHYLINIALKLTLNGTYGNLISKYSFLYDPLMAMRITINGQLHLVMLAETLMLEIPDLIMIQANTDGLTFKSKKKYAAKVREIVKAWEKKTKMEMVYASYSRIWLVNVNNYIAEYAETGKLKQKGFFEHDYESYGAWHKNFGNRCIAKAATAYLVHGVPINWSLATNPKAMDFMSTAKVTGESRVVYGDESQPIQNNTRFYYSKVGLPIRKIMPPLAKAPEKWRLMALTKKDMPTQPCNNALTIDHNNIDISWYEQEATKLCDMIHK